MENREVECLIIVVVERDDESRQGKVQGGNIVVFSAASGH